MEGLVQASRSQQSRVDQVRAAGGRQHVHACDGNVGNRRERVHSLKPSTAAPMVTLTLQPLHSVQLGEELIDHPVRDPRAVVAPPGRQGVKLVKEQDARLGGLSPGASPEKKKEEKRLFPTAGFSPETRTTGPSPLEDVPDRLLARSDVLAEELGSLRRRGTVR